MVGKLHSSCKDNVFGLESTSQRVEGICMGLMGFGKSKWVCLIAQSSSSHRDGVLVKFCMAILSTFPRLLIPH